MFEGSVIGINGCAQVAASSCRGEASTSILLNRWTRKSRSDFGFGRMVLRRRRGVVEGPPLLGVVPKEIRIVARLAAKRPGPKDPSLQWNRATILPMSQSLLIASQPFKLPFSGRGP